MEIPIYVQGHKFFIRALAFDTLGGIDLVIGSPSLADIDATLEFRRNRIKFKHTTFVAHLTKSFTLQPHQVKIVSVAARLPSFLRNANLFLRTSRFVSQFTASNMLVKFRNGFASIVINNPLDRPISFSKDRQFGIVDLSHLTQIYTPICATSVSRQSTELMCYSVIDKSINSQNTKLSDYSPKVDMDISSKEPSNREVMYQKK